MSILGIRQRLSCALGDGDSADAIESHCQALFSEMVWIEVAASREAQARGWDLIEIEYLVQKMLAVAEYTLQEADSILYERKEEVMERVPWDHDYEREEPQRLGLDHHQPIHPEESWG